MKGQHAMKLRIEYQWDLCRKGEVNKTEEVSRYILEFNMLYWSLAYYQIKPLGK